jgi:hypothetical protein
MGSSSSIGRFWGLSPHDNRSDGGFVDVACSGCRFIRCCSCCSCCCGTAEAGIIRQSVVKGKCYAFRWD